MKPNGFVLFLVRYLQIYCSFVLITMSDTGVNSISIRLIKKYTGVRQEVNIIDEYVISRILVNERVSKAKVKEIKLPFDLPFKIIKLHLDKLQDNKFFLMNFSKVWPKRQKS